MSDNMAPQESTTRTYDCPCCKKPYTARVKVQKEVEVREEYEDREQGEGVMFLTGPVWTRKVERYETTDGASMVKCSACGAPCCPRCVCVFGEGRIVCTRCTTNRGCAHDGSDYGG